MVGNHHFHPSIYKWLALEFQVCLNYSVFLFFYGSKWPISIYASKSMWEFLLGNRCGELLVDHLWKDLWEFDISWKSVNEYVWESSGCLESSNWNNHFYLVVWGTRNFLHHLLGILKDFRIRFVDTEKYLWKPEEILWLWGSTTNYWLFHHEYGSALEIVWYTSSLHNWISLNLGVLPPAHCERCFTLTLFHTDCSKRQTWQLVNKKTYQKYQNRCFLFSLPHTRRQ